MKRLPHCPAPMSPRKLNDMRRQLINTMWQDFKLFGYTTDCVKHLQKRIQKAKVAK